ncbi:thiamine pyrophosphate-dependent enzyme, partial [Micrococcus sp. SIMBA_144]
QTNEEIRKKIADQERLSTAEVMEGLRNLLPKDTIVYGDDGSHTFYAIKHFDTFEPGTFFFDDVFRALRHDLGFAIGAKLAAPEKTVVSFT